jgi:hypothetical protein
MAETIVSPGVFTDEIDQSFLPAAIAEIGAAVIGPTVKGPSLVPTVVTSYGEFQAIFGDTFNSGSGYGTYLTSLTAEQYLKSADKLTVVRILDGTTSTAHSFVPTGSSASPLWTTAVDDADFHPHFSGSSTALSWTSAESSIKLHTLADGAIMNSATASDGGRDNNGGYSSVELNKYKSGLLASGSKHNIRWETTSLNQSKGTFTLLIRRGDDTVKRKQVLETFNNVSLDPGSKNYIAKVVGDSYSEPAGTENEPYITFTGTYPPKSKYVRVEVIKKTPKYLDNNGDVSNPALSASLPGNNSGSFLGGSSGFAGFDALGGYGDSSAAIANYTFNENIGDKTQGFDPEVENQGRTAYNKALNLLSNQDEYDINMILLPGILNDEHSPIVSKAVDVCENRGDCFVIVDPVKYGSTLEQSKDNAKKYDSNYAAMYWPWIQIPDNQLGTNSWVPPSVSLAGVYAFNDKVAQPWFAPAGLNRGGIDNAIQAERKLTQSNRDDLYDSSVNPIATFPAQGVTVFGQKTLQKKSSALDRINVRRLLIKVKKFIASSSKFLVFEQNNIKTRQRFLSIANPFLEQVQSQSGLNAFRVVMDETNNTPDVVDRNILYGQIFLQPTRTAEFIVLDFTVQPTGATFPE